MSARGRGTVTRHQFSGTLAVDGARRRKIDRDLTETLRLVLRPGGYVAFTSLRSVLRQVGVRARRWQVALAVQQLVPCAYAGQVRTGAKRPRVIHGARLCIDQARLQDAVRAQWEQRLEAERMGAEIRDVSAEYNQAESHRGTRLGSLIARVRQRQEDADRYYAVAAEYLRTNGWSHWPAGHKEIWRLHTEGAAGHEIARELGMAETSVRAILTKHRARCGIVT